MQTGDGPDVVTPLAPKRVVGGIKFTRFSNAYMLVYVRESDWPRFMCQVTKDDIAPYLRERLEVSGTTNNNKQQQ
jgi:ubiquitin carboxyl-terminal hydrolase 7